MSDDHIKAVESAFHQHKWAKSSATDNYEVGYHRLRVKINPYRRFLEGSVFTKFQFRSSASDKLRFDLSNHMAVDSVSYHNKRVQFSHQDKVLEIDLGSAIAPQQTDSITVYYSGDPTVASSRAFEIDLHAGSPYPIPVQWTLSQPYGARDWWPCSQQLNDKVDSVDLYIEVPNTMRSASNGLLQSRSQVSDSTVLEHWKHRHPVSTYLIAVAVTNYEEFTQDIRLSNGKSVWVQNLMYPEYMDIAKEQAKALPGMMQLFSDSFGTYPFQDEKYGHAQFGRGGGMEHQTMSFMVDLNFGLTAHELAHQWFGDLVTCGSWQDLWLNESFATYLTYYAYEKLQSREEWETVMNRGRNEVMSAAGGTVWVPDTLDRSRLFNGRLTYRKGALVLHMLRYRVGDKVFFKACRNYLEKYHDGFARAKDFKQEVEAVFGSNLDTFFSEWIYGQGFPVFNLNWTNRNNIITIDANQVTAHPSISLFHVKLPIRIYNQSQDTIVYLLFDANRQTETFELKFIPDSLEVDPDLWILAKTNVLKLPTFRSDKLVLYPNPGSASLIIIPIDNQIEEVELLDVQGKTVENLQWTGQWLPSEAKEFKTTYLPAGVYFIRITGESGSILTTRWVKQPN